MLYDDDGRVAWNLTEQLWKMMGVIVVVCAAFGLTVSEAKTEIICLTHEGDAGGTHHIRRRGSQPDVPPNKRVRLPGGTSTTTTPICPSRSTGTYATHGAASGSTPLNYRPTERPPRAQYPNVKSRGTRDNVVRLRHVELARVPRRHAATSPPQLSDSLQRSVREQPPTSQFPTIWTPS